MWPRGFSFLILIMELSTTMGLFNLDLDEGSVYNRDLDKETIYDLDLDKRNVCNQRTWSWRRWCLRPKDLILTKVVSTTKWLDLNEGDVCNHDLDLHYVNLCGQWIWSWLRKCLWPQSLSWLRKCLWPMDLILTKEMFETMILILTKEIKGFSSLKPSCCLQKSKFGISL